MALARDCRQDHYHGGSVSLTSSPLDIKAQGTDVTISPLGS